MSDTSIAAIVEAARQKHYGVRGDAYGRAQPIASDLDPDSCMRRQVLEIVAADKKPKLDPDVLERMEAGNKAEDDTVAYMERLGLRVIRRQEPFGLTHRKTGARVVSGKIDGILQPDVPQGLKILLEAKLVETYMLDRIDSTEAMAGFWWMRKWIYQMQLYLIGIGLERGAFVLTNGKRRVIIEASLDLVAAEKAWAYAEAVVDAVIDYHAAERAGRESLPPFSRDAKECERCPFLGRACTPPIQYDAAAVIDDPGLEADIARWEELKPDAREYDALDKAVKARIKAGLPKTAGAVYRKIVGRYAIEITGRAVREGKPREARVDLICEIENVAPKEPPPGPVIIDLMAALKESLADKKAEAGQ